ncbi:MAG TPA: S8 family serine peptidase [Pyrinomonadaceae bacterium]|nr:S8 family serine peptidase [Pyrinomonadaceae bacterium]
MNRNNFGIHFLIAAILIVLAAILGQLDRWQKSLKSNPPPPFLSKHKPANTPKSISGNQSASPEVLVKFKPGVSLKEITKIAAERNDRVEDEIESVNGLVAIDDLDNASAATVAREYQTLNNLVVYAEPVFEISLDDPDSVKKVNPTTNNRFSGAPNDPEFDEQWGLSNTGQNGGKPQADIKALKAWENSRGSSDVVVAVLDTGIDYTHPDLIENMWVRPESLQPYQDDELGTIDDLHGFDAVNAADPMDDNGHGTHVAGIIGAVGDNGIGIAGINWHVKLLPLKFLGRNGSGTTKDAIEAINYAIERKKQGVNIRVINASWGSTQRSQALEDAIRSAADAGILFVAAAGNNSSNNDNSPHFPSNYNLPNLISVSATDRNDRLAGFSNFGQKTVHVAAPGREIVSTWLNGEYREASGTSMAAPFVSGVAALIIASEPEVELKELRDRILSSADKIEGLKDLVSSNGRLDALKALNK